MPTPGEFRFREIRAFDEVDSTNRYLLDEAREGAPEGVVAVADHQTAGRGRLGRRWEAPPGSALLCSVLLRPGLPTERLHLATAVVALAAAEACERVAGVRPEVKWPNDLLLGDRKLAGVLAEAELPAVVVGIGVNLRAAPPGAAALGEVDRDALLRELLAGLERRYGRWDEVAAEYRAVCATVGRRVRVEPMGGEPFVGIAERVTDEGHLVVDGRAVAAGDVHHLRPA
ncbi:MAG TPA: biotin--[acetyl-CoA-carboxylase] ligase [Acidimicrobiales bacterium]|nr:biotin--[acetyl-CoA-carboxylase] ligase [Acidimicrobiales bacterium]